MGGHDSVHWELAGFEGFRGWGGDMIAFIWNLQVLKGFMGGGDMIAFIWNLRVLKGFMGL